MSSLLVIISHPFIQVALKVFQIVVEFFTERNGIELFLHGTMQPLTDAIGLRMADLRFAMFDAFDLQVQFILMVFWLALIFRAPACQDAE
jgi:hypothetical protein